MKYIQLFEKYLTSRPSHSEATGRINKFDKFERYSFLMYGLKMMYFWFYGRMMGENEDQMMDVIKIFRDIGRVYHSHKAKKYIYRAVHIHMDKPGSSEEEVMSITKTKTGPKRLQSWSTSIQGAVWFYEHFVRDQNRHAVPHHTHAWAIVRAESTDVEELITFEECLEYFADLNSLNMSDDAEALIDRLDDDEMLKLHEIICYTPEEVPVKVVKVMIPPISKHKVAA